MSLPSGVNDRLCVRRRIRRQLLRAAPPLTGTDQTSLFVRPRLVVVPVAVRDEDELTARRA